MSRIQPPSHRLSREVLSIAGITAILVPAMVYSSSTPFPGLAALPPVLGTAALIYVGSNPQGSAVTKSLSQPVFVWIGLISYSLYLWHWPIFAFLRIVHDNVHLPLPLSIGAVILSLLFAWLSYKFIEQPFRATKAERFSQKTILSFAAAMLLAITAIGGFFHVTEGLPNRFAPKVAAIANVAQDDNPDRQNCSGKLPSEGLCLLGSPNINSEPIDFLLWGDSHAEAMRYGLDIAAQEAGQSGLFAGTIACPPIRQIRRSPERLDCTEMVQSVWTFLQNRTDAPTVILAARWPLSVEGSRYRQEAGSPVLLEWSGSPDAQPPSRQNAAIFQAGLTATVEDILATGRRVVIVGSVPEVGWNVPLNLARAEMLGSMITPPKLTTSDYTTRAGRAEQVLSDIADRYERVVYLPLSDLFCNDELCSVTNLEGLPMYQDDDHISSQTAQTLLPARLSEIWVNEIN